MASTGRGSSRGSGGTSIPEVQASVPAPASPMLDHSFTLQTMLDVKDSVTALRVKTERLIDDVAGQNGKHDKISERITGIESKVTFARGAFWVFTILAGSGWAVALLFIGKWIGK
ncbi:hypothetical protein [Lichenibacterium ramalinae]|uniref:hypothetical protein n=1 Tax=Lichenibacterium ramalinae TaxID=2316527 RepID=UPI00100E3554|nr:hypothetical protein [Lichenibacterium ramalinae]